MKKTFLYAALFLFGLSFGVASCSSDDDNNSEEKQSAAELDYSSSNAKSWGNYMQNVASLLRTDASNLYKAWNVGGVGNYTTAFATTFKNHNSNDYSSALSCIEQIIDGCCDIANEVGESKIGTPINDWNSGNQTAALYGVESWYSWHSIDDYSNNILSIRNSYYNVQSYSASATPASVSLSALIKSKNADLDAQIIAAIEGAYNAIQNIPNPFRNHINSDEAVAAQDACAALNTILDVQLRAAVKACSEEELDPIVTKYVDDVVLPTYKDLSEKNQALYTAVTTFVNNPTSANMSACATAWMNSRQPWETSEAFLFGPVDALGLDPNMDSWPLDQDAIVNILNSGNYDDLNWSDSDSEDAIEAAQNLRGFHTLEYLIFKDGQPRTIK